MMTAAEILEIDYSSLTLTEASQKILSLSLLRQLESRIEKLHKITEEVGEQHFKFAGNNLIPQVFKKFKSIINSGSNLFENFDRRELSTITHSLTYSEYNQTSIFSNSNELEILLDTLGKNWKDYYLFGLIDCYLKNWGTKNLA